MPDLPLEAPEILTLYLQLSQYPILARQIHRRMREELYRRGVITEERLEAEAKEKAISSQKREGLLNPYSEEDTAAWEQRLGQIRDHLTDFYFAYNLPMDLFHRIVEELLAGRRASGTGPLTPAWDEVTLTFNPELAPLDLLLRKVEQYESLRPDKLEKVRHHLEEMRVVLIKTMISDQLSFVGRAKNWFTAKDFKFIHARRIGHGKIGGKAAGMLLAWKVLQEQAPAIADRVTFPNSYFVGADVFYEFLALNQVEYVNQKYKSPEQIEAEYPRIISEYERGRFPDEIAEQLRAILREVGNRPLIVRSSSLLEDNFGASFAGKYASYFCPNQGNLRDNLRELTLAIRRIYASFASPDALIYRRRMGLIDYDERMAILLQEVQGERYRDYFFPTLAGVAFSQSPLVWNTRLRREEGFVRLVAGLGTRAVERVGDDYPRLIFLSHPSLRPEVDADAIQHYSQRWLDVIDLPHNKLDTVPLSAALDLDYPALRWVASLRDEDTLRPIRSFGPDIEARQFVLTFDTFLRQSEFVTLLKTILSTLAAQYGFPVDIEFAMTVQNEAGYPRLHFHLLQCRPQSTQNVPGGVLPPLPNDLPAEDKIMQSTRLVPQGIVSGIEYLIVVDPTAYARLPDFNHRTAIARVVGRLNKTLAGRNFVLVGPGRWGSSNLLLGVPVTYADIYNARALVELADGRGELAPEPSYGTHFFQDLVEAHIYSLAIHADARGDFLNRDFLHHAHNALTTLLPDAGDQAECVKVIHVPAERAEHHLTLWMNGERALGYLARGD